MNDLFALLAARATGAAETLRPRPVSRYETESRDAGEETIDSHENVAAPSRRQEPDRVTPPPPAGDSRGTARSEAAPAAVVERERETRVERTTTFRERIESVRVPGTAALPPARHEVPAPTMPENSRRALHSLPDVPAAPETPWEEDAGPGDFPTAVRLESGGREANANVPRPRTVEREPAPLLARPVALPPPPPQPFGPEQSPAEPPASAAAAPTIRISIGTVEIRAVPPAAPAPVRPAPAAVRPPPSLDDYLAARGRAKTR